MADNQAGGVAQAESETQQPTYDVKVEDTGPGTKKVTVGISRDQIDAKFDNQYKELRLAAVVPGFRKGHAPRKLLEKRFGTDIRSEVRRQLVSESYEAAIVANELKVIGEPEFENPDAIKIDDEGPLSYSFSVEVRPAIALPELVGIKVKKHKINITDKHTDQAVKNLVEQQGSLEPVEDRGVIEGDYLIADVHIRVDGKEIANQQNAQLVVRPTKIAGMQVDDLATQLAGLKTGESRTIKANTGENAAEDLRNKDAEITLNAKDIKVLKPAVLDQDFLENLGFENIEQLREALNEQMLERVEADVQRNMRTQVMQYLNENTTVDVPAKVSERQADRVVQRRATSLLMRGMPEEAIRTNVEKLRTGAADEAAAELKNFFILAQVAELKNAEVSESELNGRVAMIAVQRDTRPERLRDAMQKDGSLSNLYIQMREEKAIDALLKDAVIEEVEADAATADAAAAGESAEGHSAGQ